MSYNLAVKRYDVGTNTLDESDDWTETLGALGMARSNASPPLYAVLWKTSEFVVIDTTGTRQLTKSGLGYNIDGGAINNNGWTIMYAGNDWYIYDLSGDQKYTTLEASAIQMVSIGTLYACVVWGTTIKFIKLADGTTEEHNFAGASYVYCTQTGEYAWFGYKSGYYNYFTYVHHTTGEEFDPIACQRAGDSGKQRVGLAQCTPDGLIFVAGQYDSGGDQYSDIDLFRNDGQTVELTSIGNHKHEIYAAINAQGDKVLQLVETLDTIRIHDIDTDTVEETDTTDQSAADVCDGAGDLTDDAIYATFPAADGKVYLWDVSVMQEKKSWNSALTHVFHPLIKQTS